MWRSHPWKRSLCAVPALSSPAPANNGDGERENHVARGCDCREEAREAMILGAGAVPENGSRGWQIPPGGSSTLVPCDPAGPP